MKFILLAILCVLFTKEVYAADPSWEITGATTSALSITTNTNTNAVHNFGIDTGVGYFLTHDVELAFNYDLSAGGGLTVMAPFLGLKYNIGKNTGDAFFVRAEAGLLYSSHGAGPDSDSSTDFAFIGGIGKRFALSNSVSYVPQIEIEGVESGPNDHTTNFVFQPLSFSLLF